jgi:membrane protein DedA with SNARE-associated domain
MDQMAGAFTQYGLWLVFGNVLLTQLGAPLPAIPTIVIAGSLAQQGHWPAAAVVGVAVIACLIGDLPWYYAGRRYGYRVLNTLCRISMEPDSCVRQTEDLFLRWGPSSLMFAKFVPGFATVARPIAGALRLPLAPFLVYSVIGAVLWAGVAVVAGVIFHAQVDSALQWVSDMGARAALVIGVVAGLYIGFKWLERYLFLRFMRMMRIGVQELHDLMQESPGPVILDARSASARRLDPRRIPGALMVDTGAPVLYAGIEPDRDVVIYCT